MLGMLMWWLDELWKPRTLSAELKVGILGAQVEELQSALAHMDEIIITREDAWRRKRSALAGSFLNIADTAKEAAEFAVDPTPMPPNPPLER